jgi:hypothetical protein
MIYFHLQHIYFFNDHKNVTVGSGSGRIRNKWASQIRIRNSWPQIRRSERNIYGPETLKTSKVTFKVHRLFFIEFLYLHWREGVVWYLRETWARQSRQKNPFWRRMRWPSQLEHRDHSSLSSFTMRSSYKRISPRHFFLNTLWHTVETNNSLKFV